MVGSMNNCSPKRALRGCVICLQLIKIGTFTGQIHSGGRVKVAKLVVGYIATHKESKHPVSFHPSRPPFI